MHRSIAVKKPLISFFISYFFLSPLLTTKWIYHSTLPPPPLSLSLSLFWNLKFKNCFSPLQIHFWNLSNLLESVSPTKSNAITLEYLAEKSLLLWNFEKNDCCFAKEETGDLLQFSITEEFRLKPPASLSLSLSFCILFSSLGLFLITFELLYYKLWSYMYRTHWVIIVDITVACYLIS